MNVNTTGQILNLRWSAVARLRVGNVSQQSTDLDLTDSQLSEPVAHLLTRLAEAGTHILIQTFDQSAVIIELAAVGLDPRAVFDLGLACGGGLIPDTPDLVLQRAEARSELFQGGSHGTNCMREGEETLAELA